MSKEQERAELHRTIWAIANDLRGSVDGWDFKNYVLGFLFYRFISEDLTAHLNNEEAESGNTDFDYADFDGDWMTAFLKKGIEFYPTDHCGVIRVLDPEVDPYYLSMILDIIGRQYGFSRSYRASTERVAAVRIPLPPKEVQETVVKAGKKVFKEFHSSQMSIDSYRDKILSIMYKNKILEEIS